MNLQLDTLVPFEGSTRPVLDLVASIALKLTKLRERELRPSGTVTNPAIPQHPDIVQNDLLLALQLELHERSPSKS